MLAAARRYQTLLQDILLHTLQPTHPLKAVLAKGMLSQGGESALASMRPKSSTSQPAEPFALAQHSRSEQRAKQSCLSRTWRKKASRYIRIKPVPSETPWPQLRQQPAAGETPYA